MPWPPSSSEGTRRSDDLAVQPSAAAARRRAPEPRRGSPRRRPSCRTRRGRTARRRGSRRPTGRPSRSPGRRAGTTSTCPTSSDPPATGPSERPTTIGRVERGISSPGQSGSARIAPGSGASALHLEAAAAASQLRDGVLDRSSDPVIARDPDERRRGSPFDPRAIAVAGSAAGHRAQDRPGQAGRTARTVLADLAQRDRVDLAAGMPRARRRSPGCRRRRRRRPAGPRARCSRGSGTPPRAPRPAGRRGPPSSSYRPTGSSGRNTTARSSATGEMTDSRWTSSAGPVPVRDVEDPDVATHERRRAAGHRRRWSAASDRCTNRSGRSQNVSPPSTVPGASIRPAVGMPAAVVHASRIAGSPAPVGLARPERDRAARRRPAAGRTCRRGRDRPVSASRTWTVGPRPARRLDERRRARAGRPPRSTGRRKPWAGIVERPPERPPGPLDEDLAERRGHALGAVAPFGQGHSRDSIGRCASHTRRTCVRSPPVHPSRADSREGTDMLGPDQRKRFTAGAALVIAALVVVTAVAQPRPGPVPASPGASPFICDAERRSMVRPRPSALRAAGDPRTHLGRRRFRQDGHGIRPSDHRRIPGGRPCRTPPDVAIRCACRRGWILGRGGHRSAGDRPDSG